MLAHTRGQLIFYMGKFVNDSSSSLAPLKKIVGSKEFEGLLTLLSGVGTRSVVKLLESAHRNCVTKKAERAKGENAGKAAGAASDGPGRTKRSKVHETGRSSDHAKGTAYEESGAPQPLLSYSKTSDIQSLSEESQIYSGSYNGNHTRRQTVGLSSRRLMRDVEVEDTKLDASPYTAELHHSGPSSHGNNDSRSGVKIEYEDWALKSMETIGNLREDLGQAEDKQICSRKSHRSAYENEAETTGIGTTYPSGVLATKEKALQLESQDMYEREVGIIRRDPEIITPIEDHCCTTLVDVSNYRRGNLKKEVSQLLSDIEQLDFLFAKDRLVKYLKNRQAKMGMQTETPATWTMSEPQQVLGALRTIRTICDDAHIHRAFGQMKLCLLVQGKLDSGYRPIPSGKGKLRLPETNYLEELARREAGLSSEDDIEAKLRDYLAEHQAGKRWLQVADWFGGPGIVLVFITAGTSGLDHRLNVNTNAVLFDRHRILPRGCWMEGVPAPLSQVHLTVALQYKMTGRCTRNRLSRKILPMWSLTPELHQQGD